LLINDYSFQIKFVGKPSYHLGGDFFQDADGTLAQEANSYVKKMIIDYEIFIGPQSLVCYSTIMCYVKYDMLSEYQTSTGGTLKYRKSQVNPIELRIK
jgi:hypothetical protein